MNPTLAAAGMALTVLITIGLAVSTSHHIQILYFT